MAVLHMPVDVHECTSRSLADDRAELEETPETRTRGGRGAIIGILLGAGLWGGILVLAGIIKL
jgi:hypothetical protein